MPLLEIIRTKHTSPNTLASVLQMCKRIKKTPVVVGNCVGFTANRAFFPYGQAAALLVDGGVSPYRIDRILEKFGMPMGAFRMADLSGVDIFMHVNGIINSAYGQRCYNSSLGKRLFEAKRFGQKTGAGYYKYVKGKPVPDEQGLQSFIQGARSDAKGLPDLNKLSDEEILEILVFPIANEALRIVGEGHAQSRSDVDVATVFGYGFPAYRGGVLHYAENAVGWKKLQQRLNHYSQTLGSANPQVKSFFQPSEYLNKLAQ